MGFKGNIVPSVPSAQEPSTSPSQGSGTAVFTETPPPRACDSQCCPEIFPTASAPGSRWVLVAGEAVLPVSQLLSQLRYRPCFIGS